MKIIEGIYYFFDKVEDRIRGTLSKHTFIYTFIGGAGVILFWRGVWHSADLLESSGGVNSFIFSSVGSIILGGIILLSTGLFVSIFIGDSVIISGLKKEKKIIDKTGDEIQDEKTDIQKTLEVMADIKKEIEILEDEVHNTHTK